MYMKSKEIAAMLGVSPATVSLALNNRPGVSRETREKILAFAQENGLWTAPRPLSKGTILLLNYVRDGSVMEQPERHPVEVLSEQSTLKEKMRVFAAQKGYQAVCRKFRESMQNLDHLLEECRSLPIKGIYIFAAEMRHADIYAFQQLNIPIVTGDNLFYEEGMDSYLIDNREGIARGVDYLVAKGHSHIVYLAEDIDIFNFVERREGFLIEMAKKGLGDASHRIWHLGSRIDDIYSAMIQRLNSGLQKTTALILESSIVSMGVYKALKERQFRIPRDVSLLGFDSLPPDNILGMELTLIKGTHTKRHLAGVQHLIRRIEDENEEILKIYYRTKLLEGNSVFDKTKYIYR